MLLEKYSQDRLGQMNALAAQVFAASDPKKAGEFLLRAFDCMFPEVAGRKDASQEDRMKELEEFSKKEIALVEGPHGLRLSVKDK